LTYIDFGAGIRAKVHADYGLKALIGIVGQKLGITFPKSEIPNLQ